MKMGNGESRCPFFFNLEEERRRAQQKALQAFVFSIGKV
jgi:hypothetical protein